MSRHTGFAHLPLHPGKAPAWLFGRMRRLAREITCHIVASLRDGDQGIKGLEHDLGFYAQGGKGMTSRTRRDSFAKANEPRGEGRGPAFAASPLRRGKLNLTDHFSLPRRSAKRVGGPSPLDPRP